MKLLSQITSLTLATTLGFSSIALAQSEVTQQRQKVERPRLTQEGFTASVYYNTMNQLKADKDIEYDIGFTTARVKNLTFEAEQSPGIFLGYQQRPLEGFGFMLGGYIEKERKLTKATFDIEVSGIPTTVPWKQSTEMTLQQWGFEGNLIYSANQIYFPFGVHIPVVSIRGEGSTVTNQTGFGIQGGVGFQPTDWIALEAGIRATAFSVKFDGAKENSSLAGSGFTLLTKFLF